MIKINKKILNLLFIIIMVIFLPISFYLIKAEVISITIRNIIFAIIIGGYYIVNLLLKDRFKKN